jgi:DNA polymerase phi
VRKHKKALASAIIGAIGAPCRNRGARGDTAKLALQCLEAMGRLEPEGAPLAAAVGDADALLLAAVKTQFLAPGMPPTGVAALTRVCTLLGKVAPEATPAEEPAEPRAKPASKNAGAKGDEKARARKKKEGRGEKGGGARSGATTAEAPSKAEKRKAPDEDRVGEDGKPWKKKQRKGKAQREAERERKKAAAAVNE